MKTLIFSSLALVGMLMVGLQHQQLGQLRAENATLQQASAEASQLKADLDKSTGEEAQDAEEIARLREENHELLKLRGEINQLRDAKVQFEKVSAENQRLQSLAKAPAKNDSKQSMQPVTIQIGNLFNRGWGTPEDALQTFYWAQRERNSDMLQQTVTQKSWNNFKDYTDGWRRQQFGNVASIEIVARRDVNAMTVQIGIQLHPTNNPQYGEKIIVELVLQGNDWRVDATSR
jgi:myosin heavy subunit